MGRLLRATLLLFALLVTAVLVLLYSGTVEVAATALHSAPVEWLLRNARERALDRRIATVTVPDLSGEELWRRGLVPYHEMCSVCHGAPGVEPSVIGEGLNPRPPDLGGAGLSRQEAARAFWVIQHGLRMTGMPAFGPTHDDDELWAIVAFLDRLGRISPEEYARAIAHQEAADPSPGSAGHDGHDHRH